MGFIEKMLNGDNSDVVDSAVSICKGYLNGPWKKITSGDVSVKKLSGGLSNWLFLVRLEKGVASPKQVLLRIYGQTHGEDALGALITESVIFTLLSERRLGPRLYGVFPGGRIEEFIPARPLKQSEMSDPVISLQVAEKMAAVHAMNVPISKEPRWMWDTINRWLSSLEAATIDENNSIAKRIISKNLRHEAEWLREHLSKIYSPVVFCHNDLQQGNILIREASKEPNIIFIDFEYCSYNYRGFDLANHFIEWTYDYNKPNYPHYSLNKANYPSHSQLDVVRGRWVSLFLSLACLVLKARVAPNPPQSHTTFNTSRCLESTTHAFVEQYLNKSREIGGKVKPEVNVHSISREIKHYTLASHFFWALWSAVNANFSRIAFGYWEFAEERLDSYLKLKNDIIAKQNASKEIHAVKRKMTEVDD